MDHVALTGMCVVYVIIQTSRKRPKRFWTRHLFKNNSTYAGNLFKVLLFEDETDFRNIFRLFWTLKNCCSLLDCRCRRWTSPTIWLGDAYSLLQYMFKSIVTLFLILIVALSCKLLWKIITMFFVTLWLHMGISTLNYK